VLIAPTTLAHLLELHASSRPEAVAIEAPGRPPLTYRRLREEVGRAAAALGAMGVGQGIRVALVLPNGPEMAVAFLAVATCATSAPLNPAYRAREFSFHLGDMDAGAVLVQAGVDSLARTVARARGIEVVELQPAPGSPAGVFELSGASEQGPATPRPPVPDDVAIVLHTSGTTSRPKLVPLTHANVCAAAGNTCAAFRLCPLDRCLNVMPLYHAHGLTSTLVSALVGGGSVVCTPGFDADRFFAWMDEFRPTWYSAVPTIHQAIVGVAERHRDVIGRVSLRFVRSASAPLEADLLTALERALGAPVIEAFGMTEATSLVSANPLPPEPRKARSVGISTGCGIAILDPEGERLPAGDTGEIAISGPAVMGGYEHDPEANRAAFSSGWLRTGDLGRLDADGYLYVLGRVKEVINRGGSKVSPVEVDEVLHAHPGVAEAVTFPLPHPTLGDDVGAAVVPRDGEALTEQEIRDFAAASLADYKVPGRVFVVDEIPKSSTGKVQRLRLAERLARPAPEVAAPSGPAERLVAGVWSEVLGMADIGRNDNFFDLGGNSILLSRVQVRLQEVLGRPVSAVELAAHPTIGALGEHLGQPAAAASDGEPEAAGRLAAARDRLSRQRRLSREGSREEPPGR
jgi:acyl-CoA synthetase (AMP-forming)/AMP-acid ligase II